MEINKVWENLKAAVIVSDADFNVVFANPKAFELLEKLNIEGLEVGKNMAACHKPETMENLKILYNAFKSRELEIKHLTAETDDGTLTTVITPFFDDNIFSGVVEIAFECSLA